MNRSLVVLHVDDDESMLELSRDVFSRVSPETTVLTRDDPTSALATLASEAVDAVISDSLTLDDGRSFVVAARNEYPDVPIVLYTAKEQVDVVGPLANAGVAQYARKDEVSLETLAKRLPTVVGSGRRGETPSRSDAGPGRPSGRHAPDRPARLGVGDVGDGGDVDADREWIELGNCDPTDIDELLTTLVTVVGDRASDEPVGNTVDLEAVARFFESAETAQVHVKYGGYEFAITAGGVVSGRPITGESVP